MKRILLILLFSFFIFFVSCDTESDADTELDALSAQLLNEDGEDGTTEDVDGTEEGEFSGEEKSCKGGKKGVKYVKALEKAGVSEEIVAEIEEIMESARVEKELLRDEIKVKKEEIANLVILEQLPVEELKVLMEEIAELKNEIVSIKQNAKVEAMKLLTADQRATLMELKSKYGKKGHRNGHKNGDRKAKILEKAGVSEEIINEINEIKEKALEEGSVIHEEIQLKREEVVSLFLLENIPEEELFSLFAEIAELRAAIDEIRQTAKIEVLLLLSGEERVAIRDLKSQFKDERKCKRGKKGRKGKR